MRRNHSASISPTRRLRPAGWLRLLGAALVCAAAVASRAADPPRVIPFQGKFDKPGLTTETIDLTFRLYTTPVGGTAVWTEHWPDLVIKAADPFVRVNLGSITPFDSMAEDAPEGTNVFRSGFARGYYLGVTVTHSDGQGGKKTDAEMLPRTALARAVFAADALRVNFTDTVTSLGPRPVLKMTNPDQFNLPGETIEFDASASLDPQGDASKLLYAWDTDESGVFGAPAPGNAKKTTLPAPTRSRRIVVQVTSPVSGMTAEASMLYRPWQVGVVTVNTGSPASNNVGSHAALAMVGGKPAAAYHDATALKLVYSIAPAKSGKGTWTHSVISDGTDNLGQYAGLVEHSSAGAIAIAFNATSGKLKSVRSPAGTPSLVVADTGGPSANNVGSFAASSLLSGRAAVAYYDATAKRLKFAQTDTAADTQSWSSMWADDGNTDNNISTGTEQGTVGQDSFVGRYPSAPVLIGGKAAIAYSNDAGGGSLRYALAKSAIPSGVADWPGSELSGGLMTAGKREINDGAVKVKAEGVSLRGVKAKDNKTYPAVAVWDAAGRRLRYARASKENGLNDPWVFGPDVASGGGQYPNLGVLAANPPASGVPDRPVIGFHDGINGGVKFAAANLNATTGAVESWTIVTIDGQAGAGQYLSMILIDGKRPAFAYYDSVNGALKFAAFERR